MLRRRSSCVAAEDAGKATPATRGRQAGPSLSRGVAATAVTWAGCASSSLAPLFRFLVSPPRPELHPGTPTPLEMNVDGESTASVASSAVSQATSVVADVAATASAKVTAPSFPYSAHHLPLPNTSVLLHPASILFFTALFANVLKKIGKDRMVGLISPLHLQLTSGKVLRRQKQLKRELFEARQEMAKTSSQDEFAKWAKLRRKVDKTLADLEAISESQSDAVTADMISELRLTARLGVATSTFRRVPLWLTLLAGSAGEGRTLRSRHSFPIRGQHLL